MLAFCEVSIHPIVMPERFAPEHLAVFNKQTQQNNFPDAWALTCAQLGVTLSELVASQPEVTFRKEDLVGYHQVQYGIQPDIIEETIEAALAVDSHWKGWEPGQPLIRILPKILSDETTPAIMERILLGNNQRTLQAKLTPTNLTSQLDLRVGKEARGEQLYSFYPHDGSRLLYRGRVSLDIGRVIIGRTAGELKVYGDSVTIVSDDEQHELLVVSEQGPSHDSRIDSIRMF